MTGEWLSAVPFCFFPLLAFISKLCLVRKQRVLHFETRLIGYAIQPLANLPTVRIVSCLSVSILFFILPNVKYYPKKG